MQLEHLGEEKIRKSHVQIFHKNDTKICYKIETNFHEENLVSIRQLKLNQYRFELYENKEKMNYILKKFPFLQLTVRNEANETSVKKVIRSKFFLKNLF